MIDRWKARSRVRLGAATAMLAFATHVIVSTDAHGGWAKLNADKLLGVSGIALLSGSGDPDGPSFLVVHDNKGRKVYTARVTTKSGNLKYEPLDWNGFQTTPFDLEGLCEVPGTDSFLAMSSAEGHVYHIEIGPAPWPGGEWIEVRGEFMLPGSTDAKDYEGIGLGTVGGRSVLVWAYRGDDSTSAKIFWGTFDVGKYAVHDVRSVEFRVPWPTASSVRHVSDLFLDAAGVLLVTASSDSSDDGPFGSALYVAGAFSEDADGSIVFRKNATPISLRRFAGRKVEAITLVPGPKGGIVFGTDDENAGGSLLFERG